MTVDQLVRAIARHDLRDEHDGSWPEHPLPEDEWRRLLQRCRPQLIGLLASAVNAGFPTTGVQATELAHAHEGALAACLHLERLLVETADVLEAQHVDVRVLKGPAFCRLLYPDPSVRTFSDVDLLIRSEHWGRAIQALRRPGFEQLYGEPHPGWGSRFAKGTVVRTDEGSELDLHRTFAGGPLGLTVDVDDLFVDPVPVHVAGRRLLALPLEASFMNACYNAALGDLPPRLRPVRDVAQHFRSDIDFDRVRALARRWRAEVVVARAVDLVKGLLGVPVPPQLEWAVHYRPDTWSRVALFAYTDARRNSPREAVLGLLGVPGVRAKVDYVWPLLFPQAPYLEGRHSGRLARFRYATSRLRGRR